MLVRYVASGGFFWLKNELFKMKSPVLVQYVASGGFFWLKN